MPPAANPSLLCLSLTAPTIGQNLALVHRWRHFLDLVELRVDLLAPSERAGLRRFPQACPVPAICTIRRTRDGGLFSGDEPLRRNMLAVAAGAGYAYLDLEADLPVRAVAVRGGTRIIRSLHDMAATPHDLEAQARSLARHPGEVAKVAVMPRGVADLRRIIACAAALRGPHIVLGMGDYGVATRVLAARLGSMLTFTSADGRQAAPGHLDPRTLCERYGFRGLTAATKVYGVVGNPVHHSRSPQIHNRGLQAAGLDAVYVPFQVDDIGQFLPIARDLGVGGLSVTIPHKETVIADLAVPDPSVTGVGACNTVVWDGSGWAGYNTDAAGFLAPLAERGLLATGAGGIRRATIIGAGGAARAAGWALRQHAVELLIANRTAARAERLAAELGAQGVALDSKGLANGIAHHSDLIVQTTSAGMHGGAAEHVDPIADVPLAGHEVVYDVVYAPPTTPLLQRATRAGCQTIGGAEMLLGQAYEQFRLFTGRVFPPATAAKLRRELTSA